MAVRLGGCHRKRLGDDFESLLRCRGNMVRTDKQADLAAAMGLRPVQNPQTPLGAAPQQAAAENPEERHKIWQDSIRTLKTSPRIWALGIDGMGVTPMAQPALRRCKSNGSC